MLRGLFRPYSLLPAALCVALLHCSTPGEIMRTEHRDFWNEVFGEWQILPEGKSEPLTISFGENLTVQDPANFICGQNASPNYWTGQTPEETVFTASQAHRSGSGKGSASVMKMAFKRGQFMVVCNAPQMRYQDHIIFYGLSAADAHMKPLPKSAGAYRYAVVKEEDGTLRRFAYKK
ncbi:MAG: hypothetical protein JNJ69_17135 [Leptospiraceae bacterium]|nr:hypothetical protein [Leptospiraceae bacterium]